MENEIDLSKCMKDEQTNLKTMKNEPIHLSKMIKKRTNKSIYKYERAKKSYIIKIKPTNNPI